MKQDFVEISSKLLERWMWDPHILKQISSHYLTGEPLPDPLIQNMIKARHFQSGNQLQMECLFAELPLELFADNGVKKPMDITREVWARIFSSALFEKIAEQGLANPEMGARYVRTILSPGGSRDPNQLLADFLGNPPSTEPFFKSLNDER